MLRLIFLILSFFILSSCAYKSVPIDSLTILDVIEGEGTVFKIIDKKKLKVDPTPIKRKPLIDLQGYVCLSPEQYQNLKYYLIEQTRQSEKQSQNFRY